MTTAFQKVVLVLNIGSIMDFAEIDAYGDKISAILLAWQLGMESGNAVADVLTGQVNPSGRLTDTIAKTYADYPAQNFGVIFTYLCTLAPAPWTFASTSLRDAMLVSPGVVIANAP